jgi:hypothetical protein
MVKSTSGLIKYLRKKGKLNVYTKNGTAIPLKIDCVELKQSKKNRLRRKKSKNKRNKKNSKRKGGANKKADLFDLKSLDSGENKLLKDVERDLLIRLEKMSMNSK